jgi:hypothetical protein
VEARWAYKCRVRPWVLRAGAVAATAASAVVVWSEATIGTGLSPDLSPFSLMVRSGARSNEFLEQLLVALPLIYMCACSYFSLLKLGNFSFYHVVSGGMMGGVEEGSGVQSRGSGLQGRWRQLQCGSMRPSTSPGCA